MRVILALDLLEGKCVRLERGDFRKVKVYSEDPLLVIEEMVKKGAKDFHIVDLDGARYGVPRNFEYVKKIRERVDGYIQVGGGIRDKETVKMYTELGIDGVVVGTKAYTDPDFLPSLKDSKGIILSVDVLNGKPMVMGWVKEAEIDLLQILKLAEESSVSALLVTAIERDGTMSGPDLDVLKEIMSMTRIPVIASGGVATLKDLESLKNIGVEGVILGRAIYEKKIEVEDALKFGKE